jgi:hypothetical protein
MFGGLKNLFPDEPRPMRVLRGPFRGAVIMMSPRHSVRKIFGIYEHELNDWVERALSAVTRVVDVGANDGYFCFGSAAAFRRRRTAGEIIAFEPQREHVDTLKASMKYCDLGQIRVVEIFVGSKLMPGTSTLDAIRWEQGDPGARDNTLIKIDVEGGELDVLHGASSWLRATNRFLIEVHLEALGSEILKLFASQEMKLRRIDQSPLPLIGGESRLQENFWLVSDI